MRTASFDSNIVIDVLNGHEPARAELLSVEGRIISRVAWIEVHVGLDPASESIVGRVLDLMTLIELDEPIGRRAAAIRRDNRRLKLPDAIILATAQVHGCILVTRNTRDFPPGTPGIHVPYTL